MFLIIGVILGVITYISWMGFYWLYVPKSLKVWFSQSIGRLFFLDAAITIIGLIVFTSISDTLTAVIASSTLGLLGTLTTLCIRGSHKVRSLVNPRK